MGQAGDGQLRLARGPAERALRDRSTAVVPRPTATTTAVPDDRQDLHRIEFLGPLERRPRWEAFATAGEAREAFHRVVAGDPVTPLRNSGVWKVRLVLDGEPVEDLLVVRALPRLI